MLKIQLLISGIHNLYSSFVPTAMCSTYSKILKSTEVSDQNGVRTITLCNPKTRNALCLETLNEMLSHFTFTPSDVGCVIIQSTGPVFSSGHNLKELNESEKGKDELYKVFSTCSKLMMRIVECPVPVIAAVSGLAAAAGCQLVAQCDIAICTPDSTFSTSGANFGLFCSTPGIAIARSVSRKVALKMLLTGLPISAEEAYRSGLVSKVVPTQLLDQEIQIITSAIMSKSRPVIALGKKFFYHQIEQDLKTAYRLGEDVMVNNLTLIDGQEGIKSFIEKRKPAWSHIDEKLYKL